MRRERAKRPGRTDSPHNPSGPPNGFGLAGFADGGQRSPPAGALDLVDNLGCFRRRRRLLTAHSRTSRLELGCSVTWGACYCSTRQVTVWIAARSCAAAFPRSTRRCKPLWKAAHGGTLTSGSKLGSEPSSLTQSGMGLVASGTFLELQVLQLPKKANAPQLTHPAARGVANRGRLNSCSAPSHRAERGTQLRCCFSALNAATSLEESALTARKKMSP